VTALDEFTSSAAKTWTYPHEHRPGHQCHRCRLAIAETQSQEIRIYLDNCCFNRPYDKQTGERIKLETEAKLHIQRCVAFGLRD